MSAQSEEDEGAVEHPEDLEFLPGHLDLDPTQTLNLASITNITRASRASRAGGAQQQQHSGRGASFEAEEDRGDPESLDNLQPLGSK